MNTRLAALLAGLVVWLGPQRGHALDFFLDIASHTEGNTTSYVANVYLDADFGDFDDFVDGFVVISPGGDLVVVVTTESLSGSDGLVFPSFAAMTSALYGDWTLEQTLVGFPLDSEMFRVQSAGLTANDLPPARILAPANGGAGVAPRPTITFTGPANATDIGLALRPESGFYPNDGFALLPGNATQYTPPFTLDQGGNTLFLLYYLPAPAPPKINVGAPVSVAWSSQVSFGAEALSRFSVGGGGAEIRLLGPERLTGGQFRWSFATEAGRTYDVQFNDDLNTANWRLLQTINGDGTVKSFTVSPTSGARFYRVARR